MAFFDQKQEVMDIKLTQFGKYLLAKGTFRPEYYQFFDDDILYDSDCAGVSEHQNDTEKRILSETPRIKTQHLTYPTYKRFLDEDQQIVDKEKLRFEPIKETVDFEMQERILLYPLRNQEVNTINGPSFNVLSLTKKFESVSLSSLSESGIQKNIPTIKMKQKFKIKEDRSDLVDPRIITDETFEDLDSDEIVFADNSKLRVLSEDVVLDVQELNCFTGLENFHLNIYEIKTQPDGTEKMVKLDSMEEINKYFEISTDRDVEEVKNQAPRKRGYYKRGEE